MSMTVPTAVGLGGGALPRMMELHTSALSRKSLLQGAQPIPDREAWMLAQAWQTPHGDIPRRGRAESSVFNRFHGDGTFRDRMVCVTAGHPSSFGLERIDGQLHVWLAWNKVDSRGTVLQRRIALVPYRPEVRTDADADIEFFDPFTRSYVLPSIDLDHQVIGLRRTNRQGIETFTRHGLADFRAGRDRPLATVSMRKSGTHQGWGTYGERFWRLYGKTNKPAQLTEFDWDTGRQVASVDLTPTLKAVRATSYEPEGLGIARTGGDPCLFIGARFGSVARRRFQVFRVSAA